MRMPPIKRSELRHFEAYMDFDVNESDVYPTFNPKLMYYPLSFKIKEDMVNCIILGFIRDYEGSGEDGGHVYLRPPSLFLEARLILTDKKKALFALKDDNRYLRAVAKKVLSK